MKKLIFYIIASILAISVFAIKLPATKVSIVRAPLEGFKDIKGVQDWIIPVLNDLRVSAYRGRLYIEKDVRLNRVNVTMEELRALKEVLIRMFEEPAEELPPNVLEGP